MPKNPFGVLVRNVADSERLQALIKKESEGFKTRPRSIIPLTIVCQGLPWLKKK